MTEPDISPLAKRLAEENNVNWRVLSGSGAGGKVVERDVLEYLARVMAGEEAMNPTPEPLPEGMEAWPDEDVRGIGAGAAPSRDAPSPGAATPAAPEVAPAGDDPFEAAGAAGSGFGGDFGDEFDDDLLEVDDDPPPGPAAASTPAPPALDPFGAAGARFGGLATDDPESDDEDLAGGDGVGEISEDIFLFDDGGADDEPAAPAPGPIGADAPVQDDLDDPFAPEDDDLFAQDLGSTGEWIAAESGPDVDDPFAFETDAGDGTPVGGEDEDEEALFLAPSHPAPAEPGAPAATGGLDFGLGDEEEDDVGAAAASDPAELAWGATEEDDEAELAAFGDDDLFAPEADAGAEPAEDLEEALFAPAGEGEFELEDEERAPLGSVAPAPVATPSATATTADVPLVTYGTLLRRHVDLDALAAAQAAVARELGESEPLAPSAFLLRAAAKALRTAPLGHGPIAVATVEEGGLRVRTATGATEGNFLELVEWLRREEASADGRLDGAALVVADLSDLGIDEAVLNLGAPVLTLGRVLYDTDGGGYRSTLSLSGEVPAETGSRLLARVAELIAAPVQLVL